MNIIERRRRGLSGGETYTFVNYIQSHSAEYINTGYVPSYKARFVADTTLESIGALFGANQLATFFALTNIASTQESFTVFYRSTRFDRNAISKGTYSNKRKLYDINQNKYYEDNALVHTFAENTTAFTNPTIIFGRWQSTSEIGDGFFVSAKLYNFKLYDNDVLVRDMRPAFRDSDGEVGLLDIVNNVFYTNQGTGAFTYG